MDACGFDCLARSYRALEFILAGSMMQRARTAHLASLAGPVGRVLMLGEGPGRLLERVLQDFPSAMVTVVDQSAVMLRQAKQRFASFPEVLDRVEWIQADLRHWVFPVHRYDLVSTPFFSGLLQTRRAGNACSSDYKVLETGCLLVACRLSDP